MSDKTKTGRANGPGADTFGRLTTMASSRAQRAAQEYLDAFGLRLAHWTILRAMRDGRPRNQVALAAAVDRTTAAVSLILGEMQREGLILRRPNPDDRREAMVSLTALGARAWRETAGMADHVDAIARAGFSEKEAAALDTLLGRAIANFDRAREERGQPAR